MDEINVVACRDAFQERRVFSLHDPVPAHMRHFEILLGLKTDDFSGGKIEPPLPAKLRALRKKQLEAKTNAQERFFLPHDLVYRFDKTELAEVFHTRAESPDARQHDAACSLNPVDIPRDQSVEAGALQSLLHATQIAHAVVDNRDHV